VTLRDFGERLAGLGVPAYHYIAQAQPHKYIVWGEYDTIRYHADDAPRATIKRVQINYFTKHEFDEIVEAIDGFLIEHEISFEGPQVIYEDDTRYIHHLWECEVMV
jgi:hypothetical protein